MVPVLYVDLSPEEEALVLATLDPIGAMAVADDDRLRELLAEVAVDDEGLAALLADLSPAEPKAGLTDPDDVPDPHDASHIRPGDLFALGDHRLLCGDSTSAEDVARLMGGALADCVWTDPPYGVAYVGKTADRLTIRNDGADNVGLVRDALALALGSCSPNAPLYCAGPAGPRMAHFIEAIVGAGWRLHQELVWVKDVFVLGHSDYHYQHEPIFYGYAPGEGRPGRGDHVGSRWHGDHRQSSVLFFPRPKRSEDHPTMKPVELVEACLSNSTIAGDSVCEPFSGSGSTLMACERLGRRCFAMEIDPKYVQVAIERWQAFTGREAERIDG
jgi:site-specific DNA-methyltransferase (adenine-specific)